MFNELIQYFIECYEQKFKKNVHCTLFTLNDVHNAFYIFNNTITFSIRI